MAGPKDKQTPPTEPFKQAIAACMKAIAKTPEMEVAFASDRPVLAGTKARLPEPPRKMTLRDAAILRGLGDSMALKLACHDVGVHRSMQPEGRNARAVFEAVEQARCEAIGSRRMAGVAQNLTAMLDDLRSSRPARAVLLSETSMSDNAAVELPEIEFMRGGSISANMQRITLENILWALHTMAEEVTISPELAKPARAAVQRMLDTSNVRV